MSKLIDNEGVTKASFGILGALKEAENLSVKKQVLSDGQRAVRTKVLTESFEDAAKYTDSMAYAEELIHDAYEEGRLDYDIAEEIMDKIEERGYAYEPSMVQDLVKERIDEYDEIINSPQEESATAGETPEGSNNPVPGEGKEPLAEDDEKDCEEVEERVCESLEILDIVGNKVLLKESAGFIVGKNYNKSTGLIESAEEYKTEKIARKAFDRLK